MKLKNLLLATSLILITAVAFADNGTEWGVMDDFTVWGVDGSTADADVEIKGFTVFGSTTDNNLAVYNGTGSVFMGGALEVSSNTYLRGSLVVGTTPSQGIFAVKDNFVVSSAGNVGIGTTAPGYSLEVYKSGGEPGLYLHSDALNYATLGFKAGSTQTWYVGQKNDNNFRIFDAVGNKEAVTILSDSGNVGIGTTGPTALLHLNKNTVSTVNELIKLDNPGGGNSGAKMVFYQGAVETGRISNYYDGANWNLSLGTYNNLTGIDIRQDGNVGIGTTGSGARLESYESTTGVTPAVYAHQGGGNLTISGSYQRGYGLLAFSSPNGQSMSSIYGTNYDNTAGAFFATNQNGAGYTPTGVYSEVNGSGGSVNAYAFKGLVSGAGNNYGIYVAADKNYFGGEVGIGTTNPGALLDFSAATVDLRFHDTDSGTSRFWKQYINVTSGQEQDLRFANSAGGAYVDCLTLQNDGNVGIGTTGPLQALDVRKSFTGAGSVLTLLKNGSNENMISGGIQLGGIDFRYKNDGYVAGGGFATVNGDIVSAIRPVSEPWTSWNANEGNTALSFYTSKNNGGGTLAFAEKMRITSNGNVGIGTANPAHLIHLNGGAYCDGTGSWVAASDRAYKKDVDYNFKYGVEAVERLKPVYYVHKQDKSAKKQIGFIAQDVRKIIPEVVSGEEGSYGLSYDRLTAVLVNAIKEQQGEIEALKLQISNLGKKNYGGTILNSISGTSD